MRLETFAFLGLASSLVACGGSSTVAIDPADAAPADDAGVDSSVHRDAGGTKKKSSDAGTDATLSATDAGAGDDAASCASEGDACLTSEDAGEIPDDADTSSDGSDDAPSSNDSDASDGAPGDAGDVTDASDANADSAGPAAAQCDGGSCIEHIVIVVQENHTFDSHFGAYCTATPGSNPTCTEGPACCEAMPAKDPAGHTPISLTDTANANYDPSHVQTCEKAEIDNGKMDRFGSGTTCANTSNVVHAQKALVTPYWALAAGGALADRYFQPVAGASTANDMYFATTKFVFADDDDAPLNAVGVKCQGETNPKSFTQTTLGDLLTRAAVPWTWFYEGYAAMATAVAKGGCAAKPAACPYSLPVYPCTFDPEDVPFEYFPSTRDSVNTMKDLTVFQTALTSGTGLPAVSFVKAIGYKTEHPGEGVTLSAGVTFVTGIVSAVEASAYAASTLVVVTYDEGGGYFDHVAPPATSTVDGEPYGMRVPTFVVGPFAKKNYVSHVTMEHSSIVKFIEWNWLGQTTGQLHGRDAVVNGLGSLLDPATTGLAVPE